MINKENLTKEEIKLYNKYYLQALKLVIYKPEQIINTIDLNNEFILSLFKNIQQEPLDNAVEKSSFKKTTMKHCKFNNLCIREDIFLGYYAFSSKYIEILILKILSKNNISFKAYNLTTNSVYKDIFKTCIKLDLEYKLLINHPKLKIILINSTREIPKLNQISKDDIFSINFLIRFTTFLLILGGDSTYKTKERLISVRNGV